MLNHSHTRSRSRVEPCGRNNSHISSSYHQKRVHSEHSSPDSLKCSRNESSKARSARLRCYRNSSSSSYTSLSSRLRSRPLREDLINKVPRNKTKTQSVRTQKLRTPIPLPKDNIYVINNSATTASTSQRQKGWSLESNTRCSKTSNLEQVLKETIKSAQPNTSQQFISSFNPGIHNIEAWYQEVDHVREVNSWSERDCLSHVGLCLKGDAKVWLDEWVTNDRTWSNFKREFRSFCSTKVDYANILFNTMKTTSSNYPTYAEYARRTLLRLGIIDGLSDELRTLIVIRGIENPQMRVAAANANLTIETLLPFLTTYVRPNPGKEINRQFSAPKQSHFQKQNNRPEIKCFKCNQRYHVSRDCPQNQRVDPVSNPNNRTYTMRPHKSFSSCSFCKKPGHSEATCFAKERSHFRKRNFIDQSKTDLFR